MYLEKLLYGYKLSRFFFSLSFLTSFFIYLGINKIEFSLIILVIYTIASFFLIFFHKLTAIEFLLDITFLSAFIFFSTPNSLYFSILYLFPIFFYALLTGRKSAYILSGLSFVFYTFVRTFVGDFQTIHLNLLLHLFSFSIIAFAGIKLNERLKNQEQISNQLKKLKEEKEFYKRLYEISANLAHEIKNPLASISGASQLLKEGNLNEKLINIIYTETKRVDNLVKDFLALSMPVKEQKEKINIYNFIQNTIKTFITGKDLILSTENENLYIEINPKALDFLIRNIIKNAIEWSNSKIKISIKEYQDIISIIVEDDGKGIEEEIKTKIFEPFFSKNPNGTGLGLAIAKNIAISYDGDILVDKSELGGAKFIIILPKGEQNESSNNR